MFGREKDLLKLNEARNNYALNKFVRGQANKSYFKIVKQLKDRKLMRLREQLLKANKAHDMTNSGKIELRMRAYQAEDKENGL